GDDEELVKALQKTEARTSTFAPGLMLERKWHSGWGFGAGIFHERSEQQFQFVDKRTLVTEEVITWLVTLDSEVFISDQDTLRSYTTTEKTYSGSNRRSITRIPVE